ncbi:hypothetical protein L0F63_007476 [Massospora cicadina]|nr:hypothetical protein L0F63_007476 [Massospora cicadina]
MEELILAEAARRNVSPSDYARSLVISSLRDTSHLSARSDMSLKLQATATFQLSHFIFELMKKTRSRYLNRGGQTLIHFLRMLHQTLKRYFRAVLCVYIVSSCFLGYYLTNTLDRYMGFKYYFCKLQYDFLNLKTSSANLTLPNGQTVVTTNQAIVESPLMQKHGEALYSNLLSGGLIAGVIALASAYILFRYLVKRGRKEARDEHVRGSELAEHDKLRDAAIMKVKETGLDSRIRIADIPLIRFQENSGIGLSGSPGTGKSNAMRDLLRQVRAMKKKAVVYDISGEFVKRFYRPGIDVILNCFDARSPPWFSTDKLRLQYRPPKVAILSGPSQRNCSFHP